MNEAKLAVTLALASAGALPGCSSDPNSGSVGTDTGTSDRNTESTDPTRANTETSDLTDGASSGADTTSSGSGAQSSSTGPGQSDEWVLDFTLFVEGAVQVSGIGASASAGLVAVVTDFERVVLIDPETAEAAGEFSVQFGELPQQGSTEALSWTPEDHVAILYPDHAIIRSYDVGGTQQSEVDISAASQPLHGAMTVDPGTNTAYVIAGTGPLELVAIDLETGSVLQTTEISGPIEDPVEGLSLSINGDTSPLWAVTSVGEAFRIDVTTGEAESSGGTFMEVGEPSGLEAFVNPEGEPVLAVSDDDDQFNDEPGPLRLYLLD